MMRRRFVLTLSGMSLLVPVYLPSGPARAQSLPEPGPIVCEHRYDLQGNEYPCDYNPGSGGSTGSGAYAAMGDALGQIIGAFLIHALSSPQKTPAELAQKEINRAIKAQNKGDWDKAIKYYRKALGYLDFPALHITMGIAMVNAEDYAGAVTECLNARPQHMEANDPTAYQLTAMADQCLGMGYYYLGNFNAAEAAFRELFDQVYVSGMNLGPQFDQMKLAALYFRGQNALRDGRYEDAIRHYQDVLTVDPDYFPAVLGVIIATDKIGDTDTLKQALVHAHQLRPKDASFPDQLAGIAKDEERYAEAEGWYRTAIELDPKNENYLSGISGVLSREKKYAEAADFAKRAYQVNPNDDWNARNAGQALYFDGKYDEAAKYLKHAVALNPGDINHRWLLADTLVEAKRFDEAGRNYLEAMRQQPDNAGLKASYGFMLYKEGRNQDAEPYLRRAIELDPSMSGYHNVLSRIYENEGRLEEALISARRAQVLDPGNVKRQERIAALEAATGAAPQKALAPPAQPVAAAPSNTATTSSPLPISSGTSVTVPAGPSALDQARAAAALRPDGSKADAAQVFDTPGQPADAVYVGDIIPGLEGDAEYQRIQTRLGDLAEIRTGLESDLDKADKDFAAGKITQAEHDAKVDAANQDIANLDDIVAREKLKEEERKRYYMALQGEIDATEDAEPAGPMPAGLKDDADYQRIQTRISDLASLRQGMTDDLADLEREYRMGEINDDELKITQAKIRQDIDNIDGIIAREHLKAEERRQFYSSLEKN